MFDDDVNLFQMKKSEILNYLDGIFTRIELIDLISNSTSRLCDLEKKFGQIATKKEILEYVDSEGGGAFDFFHAFRIMTKEAWDAAELDFTPIDGGYESQIAEIEISPRIKKMLLIDSDYGDNLGTSGEITVISGMNDTTDYFPKDEDDENERIEDEDDLLSSYQNVSLIEREYEVLITLEQLCGSPLPRIDTISADSFGFIVKKDRVVGIAIKHKKLSSIPENIDDLQLLQDLCLVDDQLESLPETIGNLKYLQTLSLVNNKITAISESIGKLSSLRILGLDGNRIAQLPEFIGNLMSLEMLSITNNQLSVIPDSIGNLQSLSFLYLTKNPLTSLPETLINLWGLESLSLSGIKDKDLSIETRFLLLKLTERGCGIYDDMPEDKKNEEEREENPKDTEE
jgi:Leucine-rich repeat (LRR) protein